MQCVLGGDLMESFKNRKHFLFDILKVKSVSFRQIEVIHKIKNFYFFEKMKLW